MPSFVAELHVHTVLSPCAEIEMLPPLIVHEALDRGLDVIAITDHNASANIAAVQEAALGTALTVLPGMELQTQEEVHVLCLFDTLEQVAQWQAIVDAALPDMPNNVEFFGDQFVVDANGDFVRREPRLFLTAANLSIEEAVTGVQKLGGLAIPAHVDRKAFGLIANLGFVPFDITVEALEVSRFTALTQARTTFPQIAGYPLIQSGDVHRLDEFLGATHFHMSAATIAEIRLALQNSQGRSFWVEPRTTTPPV